MSYAQIMNGASMWPSCGDGETSLVRGAPASIQRREQPLNGTRMACAVPICLVLYLASGLCLKRIYEGLQDMDKGTPGSHRDRLRDQCIALTKLLSQKDRISISEIAESLKISHVTARRWLNSFSLVMDLRIEKGIAIIERNRPQSRLRGQAPTSKGLI